GARRPRRRAAAAASSARLRADRPHPAAAHTPSSSTTTGGRAGAGRPRGAPEPPGAQRSGWPTLHQADPGPRSEDGEDALLEPASRVLTPREDPLPSSPPPPRDELERLRRQPGARGPRRRAATAASSARLRADRPHPAAAHAPFTSTTPGGRARGRPEAGNLERAAFETSCSSDSGESRELEDLGGERRQPRARRGPGRQARAPAAAH